MKKQNEKHLAIFSSLTAALAATSGAATVQITLTGNRLSSTGGNQLVADTTGDGTADVIFGIPMISANLVSIDINGSGINARSAGQTNYVDAKFAGGGIGNGGAVGEGTQTATYLNPITFTDARINGGSPTNGYLEVNSTASFSNPKSITLTRVVFDNASTTRPTGVSTGTQYTEANLVPEPSSLALLALGAGGLLLRRQRKAA